MAWKSPCIRSQQTDIFVPMCRIQIDRLTLSCSFFIDSLSSDAHWHTHTNTYSHSPTWIDISIECKYSAYGMAWQCTESKMHSICVLTHKFNIYMHLYIDIMLSLCALYTHICSILNIYTYIYRFICMMHVAYSECVCLHCLCIQCLMCEDRESLQPMRTTAHSEWHWKYHINQHISSIWFATVAARSQPASQPHITNLDSIGSGISATNKYCMSSRCRCRRCSQAYYRLRAYENINITFRTHCQLWMCCVEWNGR